MPRCAEINTNKMIPHETKTAKEVRLFDGQAFIRYEDGTIQAWGTNQRGILGVGQEEEDIAFLSGAMV